MQVVVVKRFARVWMLGALWALAGCDRGDDDPPPPPPPVPAVAMSANPAAVQLGTASVIAWSSTNATACTASGSWTGAKATSGSESVTAPATGSASYTLTCTGAGGSATAAAAVTVTALPPTAVLTAQATTVIIGSSTTLTWSSTDATSCTASGAWSGTKSASGVETVTPAAGASNYTLTCTGAGGSIAASATVNAINSVNFLLTANWAGNVSAYKLDASTGAPADVVGSPFPGSSGSMGWVAFSSDNRFAYAADGPNIFSYSVDQVTGALAALPGSPLPLPLSSGSMAMHPSGNWIYVAGAENGLLTYAVNPTTGALTNVGTLAFQGVTITIHPSGNLAYVTGLLSSPGIFAFSIDSNGALTSIPGGPVANVTGWGRMAIDPTGRFAFVPNQNSSGSGFAGVYAFSINATTGALTPVAGSPYATRVGPSSIAFDRQGAFVYVACWGGPGDTGGLHSFAINSSTGALTQVAGSPFHTAYSWAIATSRSGNVLYEIQVNSVTQLRSYAVGATGVLTEIPGMRLPRSGFGTGMALSH